MPRKKILSPFEKNRRLMGAFRLKPVTLLTLKKLVNDINESYQLNVSQSQILDYLVLRADKKKIKDFFEDDENV